MKQVDIIAGEICAGKDTHVNSRTTSFKRVHIDLGELVREKFNTKDRVFDNNLETYFIERIQKIILDNSDCDYFEITGVRQVSLTKKIAALFNKVRYIYLVAPRSILKERYESRAALKDKKITFEDAIKGDESLGMKGLQHYLLTEVETYFIKSY